MSVNWTRTRTFCCNKKRKSTVLGAEEKSPQIICTVTIE